MTHRSFSLPPIHEISFSHEERKMDPSGKFSSPDDCSWITPSQEHQMLLNRREEEASFILLSIGHQLEKNKRPGGQFALRENDAMVDFICCSWTKSSGSCNNKILETPKQMCAPVVQDGTADDDEQDSKHKLIVSDDDGTSSHSVVDVIDASSPGRFNLPPNSAKPFFVLYHEGDDGNINEAHSFIRRCVLEGFLSKTSIPDGNGNTLLRMGFCCRFCKNKQNRAVQSIIFPESLGGIYRAVLRFQKFHLHKCTHIPHHIRDEAIKAKNGGRGSKSYWVTSAEEKGLFDIPGGKGIALCPTVLAEITQE